MRISYLFKKFSASDGTFFVICMEEGYGGTDTFGGYKCRDIWGTCFDVKKL